MKIKTYAEPGSTMAFVHGNTESHHWIIDVTGEEYSDLIERFRGITFNKRVVWYPNFFPGQALASAHLEAHIIASDDRDATLIRLSL